MANTTNYNWETPDDTDLVKDGAAAIRTLGNSADTTLKNLNPQTTTGAIAFRSATANVNTALPLGTAGQVLRVNSGATAPEWATTADQTPLTTKGDLFGFDTADARIPVGSNGHILTCDSTQALGVKWAAAASAADNFASISTISASTSTSIQFTSLTGYKTLYLIANNFFSDVSNRDFIIRINNNSTSTEYRNAGINLPACTRNSGSTDDRMISNFRTGSTSNNRSSIGLMIEGCNGGGVKPYTFFTTGFSSAQEAIIGNGVFLQTGNISTLDLSIAAGTFSGDFRLFGVA